MSEEDIKILEEFIKYFEAEAISRKYRRNISITVGEDDIEALEHLIKAYKELEEKNKKKSIEIICYQEELENSIPVSLVEEKIEELNEYYKKEIYPSLMNLSDIDITEYYDGMIGLLQELLEKRK